MTKQAEGISTLDQLVAVRNECREQLIELRGMLKDLRSEKRDVEQLRAEIKRLLLEEAPDLVSASLAASLAEVTTLFQEQVDQLLKEFKTDKDRLTVVLRREMDDFRDLNTRFEQILERREQQILAQDHNLPTILPLRTAGGIIRSAKEPHGKDA